MQIEKIERGIVWEETKQIGLGFYRIGLLSRKSPLDADVEFRGWRNLHAGQNAIASHILDANQIIPALPFDVGQVIVAFVSPVGDDDDRPGYAGAVNHSRQRAVLIRLAPVLNQSVRIDSVAQVVHGVQMEKTEPFLPRVILEEIVRLRSVGWRMKVAAVYCQQPVFPISPHVRKRRGEFM